MNKILCRKENLPGIMQQKSSDTNDIGAMKINHLNPIA
jgi:hypothetical protein